MLNVIPSRYSPFFIVGSGRSGSTLLRMILASHSKICIPPETWYIIQLVKELPLTSVLSSIEVKRAIDIITSHYRWPDMGMTKRDLQASTENMISPNLRDILDIIYNHHLKVESKLRWGDKTPPYVQIIPELSLIYPEARFIHLIRDGHDVAKSFHDLGWHGKSICRSTTEWKQAVDKIHLYRNADLDAKIFDVKYEELVESMEHVIKEICTFLNEDFEFRMLSWSSNIDGNLPSREIHIHKKLFRNPRKSDAFRWKNEMSKKDIIVIESHIHHELERVGYEVKFNASFWKPVFLFIRFYCRSILPMLEFSNKVFRFLNRRMKIY